jgi:hypothetical protein
MCFIAGTPILMNNGTSKAIEDIVVGDDVKFGGRVERLFKYENDRYLSINGHIGVTPDHPMLSRGKWIRVNMLCPVDTLTDDECKEVGITSLKPVNKLIMAHNIKTENHVYIASRVIVHNG